MSAQIPGFEGSYMGDDARIAPETRLECKICWAVYDPALGDPHRQIPPGTPFSALPQDWRCPKCDGEKNQFMALDAKPTAAPDAAVAEHPAEAAPEDPQKALHRMLEERPARLQRVFTEIHHAKMRDTPLVNRALSVETVSFQVWDGRLIGVLIAPWFMNLILVPGPGEDWSAARVGDKRIFAFPSGDYEFVYNTRPELGAYMACSLFSPMTEFSSQLQATDTARAVMAALFDPATREAETGAPLTPAEAPSEAASDRPATVSRRAVISGGLASDEERAP